MCTLNQLKGQLTLWHLVGSVNKNGLFWQQVLEKRHSQELKDLERMFQEERKVAVDEALAKMEERHAQESDELRAQNEKELKELEKQQLSPEELQQRRAQLLNQQQLRQSALDRKHADQRKQIEHGVQSDWEVRFARAKLELKEKHYQVCGYLIIIVSFTLQLFRCSLTEGIYVDA